MAINQSAESGRSVYCEVPVQKRMDYPHYQAARELVCRYCRTGSVLDLGCSDLVASLQLSECGFNVYGTDLDLSSLNLARKNSARAKLFQANLPHLPIGAQNSIDTVLLLDVLEHLNAEEAKNLLVHLAKNAQVPLSIIVSMPIISWASIACWQERLSMLKTRRRPATGLFDRTHRILETREGHHRLFSTCGYTIAEEYYTSWDEGVSGDWKTVTRPELPRHRPRLRAYLALTEEVVPRVIHPLDKTKRADVRRALKEYQGLYVLQPKKLGSSP